MVRLVGYPRARRGLDFAFEAVGEPSQSRRYLVLICVQLPATDDQPVAQAQLQHDARQAGYVSCVQPDADWIALDHHATAIDVSVKLKPASALVVAGDPVSVEDV